MKAKIIVIDAGSSKFKTCFFNLETRDAFRCDESSSEKKAMFTTVALIFNMANNVLQRIQVVNHPYPLPHHVTLSRDEAFVFFYNWKNLVFPISDQLTTDYVERAKKRNPNFVHCDEDTLLINSENVEILGNGVNVTIRDYHVERAKKFSEFVERKVGDKIFFSKRDITKALFSHCFFQHINLPGGIKIEDCHIFVSIPSKVLFREREMLMEVVASVSESKNVHIVKESVALCYFFYYSYYSNIDIFRSTKKQSSKAVAVDIGHYSSDIAEVVLENEHCINMTSAQCLYHGGHKINVDLLNVMYTVDEIAEMRKMEERYWKELYKMSECKETIFNMDTIWNKNGAYLSGQDGCLIENTFISFEDIKKILDKNFDDILFALRDLVENSRSSYLILGGPISKSLLFSNHVKSQLSDLNCEIIFTKNLFDICIGTYLYACNRLAQPVNMSQTDVESLESVLSSPSKVSFTNTSPIDHIFLFCSKDIVSTKVPDYIKKRYKDITREMYNQMIEDGK